MYKHHWNCLFGDNSLSWHVVIKKFTQTQRECVIHHNPPSFINKICCYSYGFGILLQFGNWNLQGWFKENVVGEVSKIWKQKMNPMRQKQEQSVIDMVTDFQPHCGWYNSREAVVPDAPPDIFQFRFWSSGVLWSLDEEINSWSPKSSCQP